MRGLVSLSAVIGLLGFVLTPAVHSESAARGKFESYDKAKRRSIGSRAAVSRRFPSAEEAKVAWNDLDLSSVTTVSLETDLFNLVRDSRYLTDPLHPKFARRNSWLYPQDGCWVRAGLSRRLAKANGFGDLRKVFIFGSLNVASPNAPGGSVRWWYHVAPIYLDSTGGARVVDPAIYPTGPMDLQAWVRTMVADTNDASYSICASGAYLPSDVCELSDDDVDSDAASQLSLYLDLEWTNLLGLGRDPEVELGDYPPWSISSGE